MGRLVPSVFPDAVRKTYQVGKKNQVGGANVNLTSFEGIQLKGKYFDQNDLRAILAYIKEYNTQKGTNATPDDDKRILAMTRLLALGMTEGMPARHVGFESTAPDEEYLANPNFHSRAYDRRKRKKDVLWQRQLSAEDWRVMNVAAEVEAAWREGRM